MPIRPENRSRYPAFWPALSRVIRFGRAGGVCEWPGCAARHGEPHPETGSRVVLTVAHVHDHRPENCDLRNLLALCQQHHLRLDRWRHVNGRKAIRRLL